MSMPRLSTRGLENQRLLDLDKTRFTAGTRGCDWHNGGDPRGSWANIHFIPYLHTSIPSAYMIPEPPSTQHENFEEVPVPCGLWSAALEDQRYYGPALCYVDHTLGVGCTYVISHIVC